MANISTDGSTTLEYFDGFDDYSSSQLYRYWSGSVNNGPPISSGNGRNGSAAMNLVGYNNDDVFFVLSGPKVTVSIGFAVKLTVLQNGQATLCYMGDGNNSQCDLRLNADATLSVTRQGTVLGTTNKALQIGIWQYLQWLLTISSTVGVVTIKDGAGNIWLNLTGQNTKFTANTQITRVGMGGSVAGTAAGHAYYIDDFWIDNSGAFYGDCRIESRLPNANGTTNNWTPLTGSNYTEVSDNPPDDDTSYNYSATAGNIDLYTYPALSTTAGTVYAVMPITVMKVDTVGVASGCIEYRQSSTNYTATTQNIGSTTYTAYMDIHSVDPSTSSAWTVSGVNSCQFGLKRVS